MYIFEIPLSSTKSLLLPLFFVIRNSKGYLCMRIANNKINFEEI